MSFNAQHITADNYSEAFLLYVDGELTPQQMDAVDAFVAAHPQYAGELELLLTARLGDEETSALTAREKEQLLAPQMKAALAQEDLLLYLDGELDPAAAAQVATKINADAALQQSWEQFKATKLQADEKVLFPNKKFLLRKEEKPVRLIPFYLRAAVVAGIVVATSWLLTQSSNNNGGDVTVSKKPAVKSSVSNTATTIPVTTTVAAKTSEKNNSEEIKPIKAAPEKVLEAQQLANVIKPQLKQKELLKKINRPAVEVQQEQIIAHLPAPRSNNLPAPEKTDEPTVVEKVEVVVTNNTTQPYIQTETQPANPTVSFAAVREKDKRASVRGLLRKATRFIERRTGAELTDEEDRLLIGALAVKLK